MKLFYFLDFLHLKKYGSPVTYDNYVNLEHGPIPSGILNLVNSAIDDIDSSALSDIISFETPDGTIMQRIVPARKFTDNDKKYFSKSQLDVMNEVVKDSEIKILNLLKMLHIKSLRGNARICLKISPIP